MRQLLLHVGNAIVWLTIWLAVAIYFHSVGDPPRLIGEAIIPGILWCDRGVALEAQHTAESPLGGPRLRAP